MRSSVFFAVVALAALSGCNNGQPRIYRVSLDTTPLRTIADPSCYKNGQLSNNQETTSNFREEHQWVIWDSGDGKQYLDIGTQHYKLGDSPDINIGDVIECGASCTGTFQGARTLTNPFPGVQNTTETRQTSITVAFNDEGAAPAGTVQLRAQYACVGNCPPPQNSAPDAVSCATQMSFEARRIDTSRIEAYQPVGN
jgi:hypothetical protein